MKHKPAEWLLLTAVCVLTFVVMFGHVTAIKNIALGLAVIGLIAMMLFGRPMRAAPGSTGAPVEIWPRAAIGVPMCLWLVWGALSMLWSVDPQVSLASWLDEIIYPFIGFLAFYRLASIKKLPIAKTGPLQPNSRQQIDPEADRPKYAAYLEGSCWLACLLLAMLSVYGFAFLQPESAKPGVLHFYERVGHTSTFAVIVLPLFIAMSARKATRLAGLSGIVFALVIGCASLNRFFIVSAALALVIGMWPAIRRHKLLSFLLAAVLVFGGVAAMLYSTAERAQAIATGAPPRLTSAQVLDHALDVDKWEQALHTMAQKDTRPIIWEFYGAQVQRHPWLGVGFGKPLPAIAYGSDVPAELAKVEPASKTHAHNVFLNTLLQVGVIGLILQCVLMASLLREFIVSAPGDIWLRSAGVALVVGVLSKNLTDDFLWQSTMLAFWAHAGWLLGRSRLSAMVTHGVSSGRSVAMRRLRRVGN